MVSFFKEAGGITLGLENITKWRICTQWIRLLASGVDFDMDTFHEAVTKVISSAPEASEELKQKLIELALELDRIRDNIPPEGLATLKGDVEKLAHEATKAKRESMLRVSGESILAGLKVAAELAAPAAKLIPEIVEAVAEL